MDLEQILNQKMEEGWNFQIECKGKGRSYEMTFEVNVYKVKTPFDLLKHSTGKSLKNILMGMFKDS